MNVFRLRDELVGQYSHYVKSFIQIRDERISDHVNQRLNEGMLWPEPLIQLNPSFEPGAWTGHKCVACKKIPVLRADGHTMAAKSWV